MEELRETYDLETIEQLRAIADPLRTQIYQALSLRPMTATQVGEEIGEPAPKAHYHVRELERVGLVRLVETRERGGILEKYFRAIARVLRVPPSLLRSAPPDELAATMSEYLTQLTSGFQTAMRHLISVNPSALETQSLTLSGDWVYMTPEEYDKTLTAALDLFKPYYERRGVEGETEYSLTMIGYETRLARQPHDDAPSAPTAPSRAEPLVLPHAPQTPAPDQLRGDITMNTTNQASAKTRKVIVAGVVTYSRRELEDCADRGERLDLTVIGMLSFANDVTANLVERVVERVKVYGAITASEAARAALKTKEV